MTEHKEAGHIIGIYHINLVVSDLDRSEAFYQMLGFRTVARFAERCHNLDRGLGLPARDEPSNSRAVFMKLGLGKGVPETVLDISEWIDPKGEGQPSGLTQIGLGRIALRVDDLDAIVARLKSEGVKFFTDEPQTITTLERKPRFICFRDPDGIMFELVQV